MTKLWELGDELERIAEEIAAGEGELTPELEARLDAVSEAFDEKVERVAILSATYAAQAAAAQQEEERLAAIRRSYQRVSESLKAYLLAQMTRAEVQKVQTHRVRVRVQKNSRPSIQWGGPLESLPAEYQRVTITPDATLAYEQWKAGDLPEGWVVVHGSHVRIN